MRGKYELLVENEKSMIILGGHLAQALGHVGIVFLHGEFGTGKTTFCRGVLRYHGYHGPVKSPTYTLVEPYEIEGYKIYHFDLYRLADPQELEFIGGRDYFSEEALFLIEWPSRGQGELPDYDLKINFEFKWPGRQITILSGSDKGMSALEKIMVYSEDG